MGKLVVCTNLSLDGVMQGPARGDEDARNGFRRGGWAAPYAGMMHVGEVFQNTGALLLGRRTYLDFADVWPRRGHNPMTTWLTRIPKYVVSTSLEEPLPWENSTLLVGDLATAVPAVKREVGKDILVMGSGELIESLMRLGLVDEWVLLIHPLVLGSGRRLFPEGGVATDLTLVESRSTPGGVVIANYRKAEPA